MASDIDLQNISKKGVLPSASCYFILPVQSILIPPYISIQGSIKRRKRRFFKDAVGFPEKNRVSVTTKVLPKSSLHLAVVSFLSPTLVRRRSKRYEYFKDKTRRPSMPENLLIYPPYPLISLSLSNFGVDRWALDWHLVLFPSSIISYPVAVTWQGKCILDD